MCLFGLVCCSEKLWEVTISLLCCTEYQRILPAETEPFDMWPLQTYTYNGSSGNSPSWCCVGKVKQICFAQNQPCTFLFQPYIFSAKQIRTIFHILNTGNPAMCLQSEIEMLPLSILLCHKVLQFHTIAPLMRAYGTGQVKCSDLANSPKTGESRVHVRRRWVCWHKQYPECGSDRHPALVSLLLSY